MADLILIGDRVLIQPDDEEEQRESGLVLPASVKEKEKVQSGYVVRVGPGYLTQNPDYTGEPWSQSQEAVRYLPLQAQPGDYAFFVRKEAVELAYQGKAYLIIQHGAILALVRKHPEDMLDDLGDLGDLFED